MQTTIYMKEACFVEIDADYVMDERAQADVARELPCTETDATQIGLRTVRTFSSSV